MDVTAEQLVLALTVAMGRDPDEDAMEYLIDNLAEAIATLMAVLQEILEASKDDERTLL
jgi:predicted house-cleaning noncanonical NTP pyrophosphatase (MazG superfamily)